MSLKLDWCSHKAALYAVKKWHYSRCLPAGKTVKIGVWEDTIFIGAIIFSLGANAHLRNLHGKTCELSRVALNNHKNSVTRIVSISLMLLKRKFTDLDCVVSYADLDRHTGKIYEAGNWVDDGEVVAKWLSINGKKVHPRSVFSKFGTHDVNWLKKNIDINASYVETKGKRRFLWFFDKKMRRKHRIDAGGFQPPEGSESLTPALQNGGQHA